MSFIALFLVISFGAQVRAQAPSEFLNDLDHFQAESLSIKSQKARLDAIHDNRTSKRLFWTPDLSLALGDSKTAIYNIPTDTNYFGGYLNMNFFKGGADLAHMHEAENQFQAQTLTVKNEELQVESSAADLIFNSIFLKESLRVQQALLKLKEDTLQIVKDRYNQGKAPLQEVKKAEVDLSQQKNKARVAELSVKENQINIESKFVSAIQTKIWPFTDKLQMQSPPEDEHQPLVEEKYWLYRTAEESWKAAQRSYLPTIDLSLEYQKTPLKEQTTDIWTSLVELRIPLWSRFETAAAVSSSYANYVQSQTDYQSAQKLGALQSQFLEDKIEESRVNLTEAKVNVDKSETLYRDILKSFKIGRLSMNDLFIEQNRLFESENDLAQSQLSFHQAVVQACAVRGFRVQKCLK